MVPCNGGEDPSEEDPEANNHRLFFVVTLTGEESTWLPRPFLSGAEPRAKTFRLLARTELFRFTQLTCPSCGSRRVTVVFEPPTNREVRGG
jgi:hypothetical protein